MSEQPRLLPAPTPAQPGEALALPRGTSLSLGSAGRMQRLPVPQRGALALLGFARVPEVMMV